jgi:hypothetical protein
MLLFPFLGESIEDFTGKLNWLTSLVMKQTPKITFFFNFDTDLGSSIVKLTDTPKGPLEIRKQSITFSEEPLLTTSF